MATGEAKPVFRRQGIDYLGFLGAKLRDLQGPATLVYELVQNADDAPAVTSMVFDVRDEALEVSNDGVFRDVDFVRMQNIAGGGKRDEEDTTGAFGIGFIAVYQITDRPELFSAGRHWTFRPEEPEHRRIAERRVSNLNGTRFRLPWAFDANSLLRRELRAGAISKAEVAQLAEDLIAALPKAILFLRRISHLEVRRNGKARRSVRRTREGNAFVVNDGKNSARWHVFDGAFAEEAALLREKFNERIEKKRKHTVTVAIPEGSRESDGLLCAFLPTQTLTGLTFHINADFFPSSDRKRILFDKDYQGDWNRAALSAAAHTLGEALPKLPKLLGHGALWNLLTALQASESDEVFGELWERVEAKLSHAEIVYSSANTWHTPSEIRFLEKEEEEEAIPILEALGVDVVHPDLRRHQNLLRRSAVGVKLLEAADLAGAVHQAGLDRVRSLADTPKWLHSREARAKLARELRTLLDRRMSEDQRRAARDAVEMCAIAIGQDKQLHPLRDLHKADKDTVALFTRVGVGSCFLARDNPPAIDDLVDSFDLDAALEQLGTLSDELLESTARTAGWKPRDLLRWFELGKGNLSFQRTALLCSLPVFPSGGHLKPLSELAVPGEFVDPLQLASLIDLDELPGLHDFIRELGATELTFDSYCRDQVPAAFAESQVVSPEARRKLLVMLANHLGEIRDDDVARSNLAMCPLVECEDGEFRKPSEVYVAKDELRRVLGDGIALAKEDSAHPNALLQLLLWLGVAPEPRGTDLRSRIQTLTEGAATPDTRSAIKAVFAHFGSRWKNGSEGLEAVLEDLKDASWLPAVADQSNWHTPGELYGGSRSYLFASQARFLDVEAPVQNQSTEFTRWLGIQIEPNTSQVAHHLLACAAAGSKVNLEVYRFLNEHADDREISILTGKASLLLSSGAYVRPDQVFWGEHPFGTYRHRLDSELRVYGKLFDRLKVRESAQWDDAVRVLREVSEQYGTANVPLDDAAHAIVMQCWAFLEQALLSSQESDGEALQEQLPALNNVKVIPDRRRLLVRPDWMFFEDRPGLAQRFGELIKDNTIRRVQNAWRAMEAAGVRPLSRAVRSNLVDAPESAPAEDITALIVERRGLIARVAEAYDSSSEQRSDLGKLNHLRVERARELAVSFTIEAFGLEHTTDPESAAVNYDQGANILYFVERNAVPWAAIARELAYVLNSQTEAGQLAPGLKEVLSAQTANAADEILDELGYARLEELPTPSPNAASPIGLGGEDGTGGGSPIGDATDAINALLGGQVAPPTPPSQEPGQDSAGASSDTGSVSGGGTTTTRQRSRLRTYVAPPGATTTPDNTGASIRRSRIEQAGINHVLDFERRVGRDPVEMPTHHPGYDIESKDGAGEVERYIEVKALSGGWDKQGAGVSKTEFNKAREIGDRYWLYVVERADRGDFRILRIHDPARQVDQYLYDDGWRGLAEPDPADLQGANEELGGVSGKD